MPEADQLVDKAETFLSDAESGLEMELSLETVQNRIYYSLFHAAKAALLNYNVEPGTHSGVNAKLGQVLIQREGVLDKEMGRFYSEQMTLRERADYDPDYSLKPDKVKQDLEKAKELFHKLRRIANK